MAKKVYVGLSGGVDSSVAAALLKEQGYSVVGVYMKNWTQSLPGFACPWKEDYQDAKRVAVQLNIPFKVFDFQKKYRQKVVNYMVGEYKAGRTPNPDIMCNQEIKFKLFLDTALEDNADLIATGHYARINKTDDRQFYLQTAKDKNKDQTYFLYRMSEEALSKTLFPLGGYTKPQVRALAKKFGLVTAAKKESMGICFVGKVGIKEFLSSYVKAKPGNIIDQNGSLVGRHDGAIFYTIGQRQGLGIGGQGLPYYVAGKNMAKNEVYVTTNLDDNRLWNNSAVLADQHWINVLPQKTKTYQIRTRHRAPLTEGTLQVAEGTLQVAFTDKIRALTPGQSAVVYDGPLVLGGGIISY